DPRHRQGRHGGARPRPAVEPALALARRRRTRRHHRRAAPLLAQPAARVQGAVRADHLRAAMSTRRAVVFDMDGLMLDTERVALECGLDTARAVGWEITREDCLAMVGLDQRASERALLERVGPGFPLREVSERAKDAYLERLRGEGIGLKRGLVELLDWLAERSVPVAVATSSRHLLAMEKLALAGLRERFAVVVCGDQVPEGKPA